MSQKRRKNLASSNSGSRGRLPGLSECGGIVWKWIASYQGMALAMPVMNEIADGFSRCGFRWRRLKPSVFLVPVTARLEGVPRYESGHAAHGVHTGSSSNAADLPEGMAQASFLCCPLTSPRP